jgi:hypothetical protein
MCCSWCDAMPGRVKLGLAEIWQRCFHCSALTWVDPYTLLCRICADPVKNDDNVTLVCDRVANRAPQV